MAKPALLQSVKFRRLCHVMASHGIKKREVLGMLEFLWQTAHSKSDAVIGDSTDVEVACEWDGESGLVCSILTKEGWIDTGDVQDVYSIHDYWENAPHYVQERMRKRLERERKGKELTVLSRTNPRQSRTNPVQKAPSLPYPTLPIKEGTDTTLVKNEFQEFSTSVFSAWKASSETHGHPGCNFKNKKVESNLRARFKDSQWRDNWQEALSRIQWNPWRLAEGKQHTTLEWFTREDTLPKLMEMTGPIKSKPIGRQPHKDWTEEANEPAPF